MRTDSLKAGVTEKWLFLKAFKKRTCQCNLNHETLCAALLFQVERPLKFQVDRSVWPFSSNPYSISDQKFDFSYPICRPLSRIKDYERFGSVWLGRQIEEYFSLLQCILKVCSCWRFLNLIHCSCEIFLSEVTVVKCKSCSHYVSIDKYTKSYFQHAVPIFNDAYYFLHQSEYRFGMDWCGANGEAKFGVRNICTWKLKWKSPMKR